MRRRPKELDSEPALFEATSTSGGAVILSAKRGRQRLSTGSAPTGEAHSGGGSDEAQILEGASRDVDSDLETLRLAQRIAARLLIPRARNGFTPQRGFGDVKSVRYKGDSDEIDIDATLEQLAQRPFLEDDDVIVRQRVQARRSVVVVVDVSGSMRGERARIAAATVGALAGQLPDVCLAVIAFWSDAVVLTHLGQQFSTGFLVNSMVRIPARGLTNIAFPLQIAHHELARIRTREARVLLLSDCVHNAGPDPRPAATILPRLDVILDTSAEHDSELASDLAYLGRGRLGLVSNHREVASAISGVFAR